MRDESDGEDLRWVRRFLDGDESAFDLLFEKYREKVHNVAYRFVRNQEDSLEITQDVFLRVYTGLRHFKTHSRFFTWLYRIAVNRSIDFTRGRKNQPLSGLDMQTLERAGEPPRRHQPGPVQVAQERELEEKIQEAIDDLSPKHKAVIVLHAVEDLSYKQIAEVLDCNIGTVMSRLFYARKKLKELLESFGFTMREIESGES